MKYGVNRVTLVGNVGEVPKVSEREGEAFVANFPLATNEVWKDKEGEEVRKTEWHRIVVWNKAADIVKQHVKKGDALYFSSFSIIIIMIRYNHAKKIENRYTWCVASHYESRN